MRCAVTLLFALVPWFLLFEYILRWEWIADAHEQIEKNIVQLGGVKVLGKTPERENGWFANFKDPEGNRFGTYETNWDSFGKKE